MGFGKSSGSSQATLTPEQRDVLSVQTEALKNTFLPAYQNTIAGAGGAYNIANPAATQAAQTAMDVASQTGQLQQQGGTNAYQQGMGGMGNMAAYQQGLGQGLTGAGAGGLGQSAGMMSGLGQGAAQYGLGGAMGSGAFGMQKGQNFANVGGLGTMNVAGNQAEVGQQLQNQGASALSQLFSPQYKQEQINAAMQPAREDIREQLGGQNAMFGGAGGLGSSRMALANQNLSQLGQQRLATAAATASGNVEAQRQQAANALMGAGQGALGQSGNLYQNLTGQGLGAVQGAGGLYGNIFGQGAGLMGQGANAYGQILSAGQGANAAAQQGYGNLGAMGQQGLNAANQAAAARIGYAGTPQDVFSKYASVIYGVPQASTTPNFAGTQGQTTSSKGFGLQAPKWG
jgi:hypothetical protein